MTASRRSFLRLSAGLAALPAVSRVASAQTYPSRTVHVIVGLSAGGTVDIMARLLGQYLSERLGQSFVIENRPGAGTNIATEAVVKAPSDGYTLLLVTASNTINATLYDRLNFNFIRDIAPVAGIVSVPYVLEVNPSVPVRSVSELIAYAKANPGRVNFASSGIGSSSHLAGELFKTMAGIDMLHVPYRGSPLPDLLGGRVQVYFSPIPSSIGYLRTGELRALAVTAATRQPTLPDIPTAAEFVPGFEASNWIGVGAPKGTPQEVIDKVNSDINAGLTDPALTARIGELGGSVLRGTSAEFGRLITDETKKWGKVVRAANIRA